MQKQFFISCHENNQLYECSLLRIRNCSEYSELMTSHALGGLEGSQRTLLHAEVSGGPLADVMAAIFKVRRRVKNPVPMRIYEEQSR